MRAALSTVPSSPGRDNEDLAAVTPTAAVLLDGAGTPEGSESGCVHGVPWFVRELGTALLAEITAGGSPLADCLATAIGRMQARHGDRCDLDHTGSPSATVLAVRTHGETLEYLVLADSVLLIDQDRDQPLVITDDREAQAGRELRKHMDSLAGGTPEHTEARREYVETLRSHRNQAGGFWVASTDPAAAHEALTGSLPLADVRSIALLSDGASRLVDRFALASWSDLLRILATNGPDELIRQVRAAEASDPHGSRWPRGKATDDASAVYLTRWHSPTS